MTILARSLYYGGAERQLVALATGLRQRGHDVAVAVFYPGGPLATELEDAGVPVHILNKRGRWDVFGFLGRLLVYIRTEAPDILHGYLVVPNLLTLVVKPFLPRTKVVWGVRASNMDLDQYDWLARLTFRLSCWLSRFADRIIVNSHCGKVYHEKRGYPARTLTVICNGIDTERFRPARGDRQRLRAEWNVGEEEVLIGLVGRLDPMKGHASFLRAAAILLGQRSNVRFVCVGDGPTDFRANLIRLGKELGLHDRLIWAGGRSDTWAVYNSLDIATSASLTEGFSNVIGEAMSCGVLCVVTDVGDSAVMVGDFGVVVPPNNPSSLAEGWNLCLSAARLASSEQIRGRIVCEYSVKSLIERTEQCLKEL